ACLFCTVGLHAQSAPKIEENPPPLDPKDMDTSVKPQDDFFMYANGGWIKNTEIPPEYSRWGSFNQLVEHNNDALHEIAEKAASSHVDPKTALMFRKSATIMPVAWMRKRSMPRGSSRSRMSSNGSTQ